MDISTILIRTAPRWFLVWSHKKLFGRRDVEIFKRFLESKNWQRVATQPTERWIFYRDNSFVIEISNESNEFQEPWTESFPKGSRQTEVFLKINNEYVCPALRFVYVDEYRYFVPMPQISRDGNEERYFYWNTESLEYHVYKIIGDVSYMYQDLEGFAEANGILITNVSQ